MTGQGQKAGEASGNESQSAGRVRASGGSGYPGGVQIAPTSGGCTSDPSSALVDFVTCAHVPTSAVQPGGINFTGALETGSPRATGRCSLQPTRPHFLLFFVRITSFFWTRASLAAVDLCSSNPRPVHIPDGRTARQCCYLPTWTVENVRDLIAVLTRAESRDGMNLHASKTTTT